MAKQAKVAEGIERQDPAIAIGADGATKKVTAAFIEAVKQHRHWDRELQTLPKG